MHYAVSYEINYNNNTDASYQENQHPSHYTWNFVNGGTSIGTLTAQGYNCVMSGGIPNVIDFGQNCIDSVRWMSGYGGYFRAMHNKLDWWSTMDTRTPEALDKIKQWFNDHAAGTYNGGIVNFSSGNDLGVGIVPDDSEGAGMDIIHEWQHASQHAMTFVGYDDNVKYDFNNDGEYTNDIDINGDEEVNMADWEIGALIVANSYGLGWGNQGFMYMMYRLLYVGIEDEGGISMGRVKVPRVKQSYEPLLTYRITLQHDTRDNIGISAGVSDNPADTEPQHIHHFNIFNFQGGSRPLPGTWANNPIEIGLDVTPLLNHFDPGQEVKFFLDVRSIGGSGDVLAWSLLDYTGDEVEEVEYDGTKTIEIGNNTIGLSKSVDYQEVAIATESLPAATLGKPYSQLFSASGGSNPYRWHLDYQYTKQIMDETIPDAGDPVDVDGSDDGAATLKIPFAFPFYGDEFNRISVSTNGDIYLFPDLNRPGFLRYPHKYAPAFSPRPREARSG